MIKRASALWFLLGVASCSRPDLLTIVNQSGTTIASLHVTVDQTAFEASDVPDGAQRTWSVQPDHDGSFAVAGKLADGTLVVAKNLGYLTPGKPMQHILTIERGGKITYRN